MLFLAKFFQRESKFGQGQANCLMHSGIAEIRVEQSAHQVFETQVINSSCILPVVSSLRLDKAIDYLFPYDQTGGRPHFPFGGIVKMTGQGKAKLPFD
jgi:hypothetical protein